MQQFTRSLTREIQVGGERLIVTLSKEGLSVRPLGGRRPPHTMSWGAWLCACVAGTGQEPTAEQIQQALQAVHAHGSKPKKNPASAEDPPTTAVPFLAANASTASASSGHPLEELLSRVDHWLSAHRPRFRRALLPGASSSDCDALAAALGKPLPEELRIWLTWHNGQNADVPGAFEQSWNLMSTQQIAEAKKELDAEPDEGWQQAWVPFLDDDNGNYLCLDLGSPGCPVRECWRGRSDHPTAAPSLTAWLSDFLATLERGAYTEDPERGTLVRHS
ncbi:MAG TPA: SMI1/KNR4 family protein [Gemmataceae bacterium]|jgi:cell wall assembly regulator SMI1